ncbi:MAG: anti-sigma factor family protein [Planctomycetota bacterium]
MNTNCSDYCEDLAAYERLDTDTKNRVDAHLASCTPCARVRANDAAIFQMLQNDPGVKAGAEFDQHVHSIIHCDKVETKGNLIFRKPWIPIATFAAFVLASIAISKFDLITTDKSSDDDVIANLDILEPLALLNDALSNDDASLLFAIGSLDPKVRIETVVGASDAEEF